MSSPQAARARGKEGSKKRATTPNPDGSAAMTNGNADIDLDALKEKSKDVVTRQWDYKLAFAVITGLAFLTRFWGISHPDQVVFDEVHFGKVSRHCLRIGVLVVRMGADVSCAL